MSIESIYFWCIILLTFCWILHDFIIHQEWKNYIAFIKWIRKITKKKEKDNTNDKI